MNGTIDEVQTLLHDFLPVLSQPEFRENIHIIVCPAFVHLERVLDKLQGSGIAVGAQDVSAAVKGAYTGQISAKMLADIGCKYVIIGHSERRQYCAEGSEAIAKKLVNALEMGITPIFCVGETKAERESGITEQVIQEQILSVLEHCPVDVLANSMIAYEPVWAIGTGVTATPEMAQAVHAFIRTLLAGIKAGLEQKVPLLYGGSVNESNAEALFSMPDIDGGLIGGASLKAETFIQICEKALRAA